MKILTPESISELISEMKKALENNQTFSYNKDGLNISADATDSSFNCIFSYKEDNHNKQIREEFYNYCDTLPSDLFTLTCESIPNFKDLVDTIDSDESTDEQLTLAIASFKNALKAVYKQETNKITDEINLLDKKKEELIKKYSDYLEISL